MPDGSVYIVRHPAAETHGDSVEMEFVLPTGCVPPPPHIHPHQVEEYEVLEGRLDVVVDGEWRTIARGESAVVPVGALHTFRNHSGSVVRVRNWHPPAMRFEDFIERTCRILQAAGVKRRRDPRAFLYLSMGHAGVRRHACTGARARARSDGGYGARRAVASHYGSLTPPAPAWRPAASRLPDDDRGSRRYRIEAHALLGRFRPE